jgi:hypothetical protein
MTNAQDGREVGGLVSRVLRAQTRHASIHQRLGQQVLSAVVISGPNRAQDVGRTFRRRYHLGREPSTDESGDDAALPGQLA